LSTGARACQLAPLQPDITRTDSRWDALPSANARSRCVWQARTAQNPAGQ
jgi:hypothetical protein